MTERSGPVARPSSAPLLRYHSVKAGHDDGQYVRDAENAGLDDIAAFFRE